MRTTFDIDAALLKRLRVEARRRGLTVKRLLATLIERGLAARPANRARFRGATFAMGVARVPLDKALTLVSELEDQESARKLALRK